MRLGCGPNAILAVGRVPGVGGGGGAANLVLQNWGASRMHQENYHHDKALKSASGK